MKRDRNALRATRREGGFGGNEDTSQTPLIRLYFMGINPWDAPKDYTRLPLWMPKFIILDMRVYPFGLKPFLTGGAEISIRKNKVFRLLLPSSSSLYCDSQLDDYQLLARNAFKWTPPVRCVIQARTSHAEPSGTLGFGFWNDPFTMSLGQGGASRRLPAPPQTLWFFYGSSKNDLPLDARLPGFGWKAASLRSPEVPSLILAPIAATAIGLSYIRLLRSWIIKSALRQVIAAEAILDVSMLDWHTYSIEWSKQAAIFTVDDVVVLNTQDPPDGPLGFVLWIDNQFAVASPLKGFHFGTTLTKHNEWLEVKILELSHA